MSDRAIPVAVGGEAAYLAMIKAEKLARNPFLRAATGADPDSIVRNGYVFDVAFYAQRFGLAAPDIVINGLGTNDARDETLSSIYDVIYHNDILIHSQIRAAWPQAKILRTLPATAFDSQRNAIWKSHYSKIIRAMKAAASALPGAQITVAPLWAFTNPEGGYTGPTGAAGEDGFTAGDWSDPLHFSGAPRQAFYKAMAPYLAAQKLNII
jgi:lysophospholipase L1-like esterase